MDDDRDRKAKKKTVEMRKKSFHFSTVGYLCEFDVSLYVLCELKMV